MKTFLIIFFVIIVLVGMFCIWVLARIGSIATNKEEQMEIERKLKNGKR